MKRASSANTALNPEQRKIVLAVSAAAVTLLTLSASFNYVLPDMLTDLDATDSQTDMARQIPTIAALLVIFIAGAVGERMGARRVMLASTVLYALGSVIVTVAPIMPVATLGLLFANVGKSALFVVGLAHMSSQIASKEGRAAAFATFSAVMPVTYLLMPLLAGVMLANSSWRTVATVWCLSGLLGTIAVWRLLPVDQHEERTTGELLTPALAGLVLAALVQVVTILPDSGLTTRVAFTMTVGIVALITLWIAMRRMSHPTLSLAPLRHGGLVLLLIVLILTMFANLWFYMTMALQYMFGLTSLQVAVVLVPAQLLTIIGAGLAGKLVQRRGVALAGTVLLVIVAVALATSAFIDLATPVWLAVGILSIYSAAAVGSGVALTNAIMDLAGDGEDGSAAAFRGAASNLGSAIGVAAMTSIVFFAAAASLQSQAIAAGIDPTTASEVATAMRDGATSEDTSSLYSVPVAEVDSINSMQQQAYAAGLQAHGIVGAAVTLVAAGLFYVVRRRQETPPLEVYAE